MMEAFVESTERQFDTAYLCPEECGGHHNATLKRAEVYETGMLSEVYYFCPCCGWDCGQELPENIETL